MNKIVSFVFIFVRTLNVWVPILKNISFYNIAKHAKKSTTESAPIYHLTCKN